MNKPLALGTAVERAGTPLVAWLDSDIAVVSEPAGLLPRPGEDFTACPRDRGTIGSTGPSDTNDAYWAHVAGVAGLRIDDLPWVTTVEEGLRIRLYWNSGVFVFAAHSGFAEDYLRLNIALLDARIGTRATKVHYTDQVAPGLSMVRTGLRWRALGGELNCGVSRWHADAPERVAAARIVHYHDSLRPDFFPSWSAASSRTTPKWDAGSVRPARCRRRAGSHAAPCDRSGACGAGGTTASAGGPDRRASRARRLRVEPPGPPSPRPSGRSVMLVTGECHSGSTRVTRGWTQAFSNLATTRPAM